MSAAPIPLAPNVEVAKDPNDQVVYGFTWDAHFAVGVQLTSSFWFITAADGKADDSALTFDSAALDGVARTTAARIKGGTLGRIYRVTNRVITNESPTQQEERSFLVNVQDR